MLRFDLRQSSTESQFDGDDVVLVGGGLTLIYDTADNPGTDWTSYSVVLDETGGWINENTGEPATQQEIQNVLADLTALRIRGEFVEGADTGSLDNVFLADGDDEPCDSPGSIQIIDFETIPCETPREGLVISDQFSTTTGVSFRLEGGGHPVLADVGGDRTAFVGPSDEDGNTNDTVAPGQNVGQYFLTDDGDLDSGSTPLIVTYDPPTAEASGYLLDVDGGENYTIEARDANGDILETVTISDDDPEAGDGLATYWSIDRENADIVSIRFVGEKPSGLFGLGFDNFNARSITPGNTQNTVYLPYITRGG
jgi:hypothetical protein